MRAQHAVANSQWLANLRLQGLGKIRAVAAEPRATTANENGGVVEFDKASGAALPLFPTSSSKNLTLDGSDKGLGQLGAARHQKRQTG